MLHGTPSFQPIPRSPTGTRCGKQPKLSGQRSSWVCDSSRDYIEVWIESRVEMSHGDVLPDDEFLDCLSALGSPQRTQSQHPSSYRSSLEHWVLGRRFVYDFLQIPPRRGHPCLQLELLLPSPFRTFALETAPMPGTKRELPASWS